MATKQYNIVHYKLHTKKYIIICTKNCAWSPYLRLNIQNLKVHLQRKKSIKSNNTFLQVTSQECIA